MSDLLERWKEVLYYDSHGMARVGDEMAQEITRLRAELEAARDIVNASEELLEVARLRGDDELPHPCDDQKLWTARMQTAWEELGSLIDAARGESEGGES